MTAGVHHAPMLGAVGDHIVLFDGEGVEVGAEADQPLAFADVDDESRSGRPNPGP